MNMISNIERYLLGLLLLVFSTLQVSAQYNPDNPSEPGNPSTLLYYKVTLESNLDGAGTVTGGGKVKYNSRTTLKATANSGYKFLYWQKNNETTACSTSSSYQVTVTEDVKYTAVFEKAKKVTLIVDSDAGTVSGSGSSFYKGNTTTISTVAKTNYEFKHWLKDDSAEPYSTQMSFQYTIEDADVTFTAIYEYVKPEYNPANPAEPTTEADKMVSYNVTVQTSPEEAGSVTGAGKYLYGKSITLNTSPNAGYEFRRWLKGNEEYSTATSFNYTVTEDVIFTAEYEWVGIPEPDPTSHKLFLEASPVGSCTFDHTSGADIDIDANFSVTAVLGTDQEFLGWYQNGVKVSDNLKYNSIMLTEDITLVAKCKYNPGNPDEPTNEGFPEEDGIVGDVNGDGDVDTADAVLVINKYLGKETDINTSAADMNSDGEIDTADAVLIINKYLNK